MTNRHPGPGMSGARDELEMDEMASPPLSENDGRQHNEEIVPKDCRSDGDYDPEQTAIGVSKSLIQAAMSWRNVVAFWIFGLCNNFGYVIMLSAAHDILSDGSKNDTGNTTAPSNVTQSDCKELTCNNKSTGIILLADILPTLIIKFSAPWFMNRIQYVIRVAVVIVFAVASLVIVALAHKTWLSLIGVACASISSGFGEITFLSYTSHFHKSSVSAWSSGTGAAGMVGALSYASLAAWLGPRDAILSMLIVPALLFASYAFILDRDVMWTADDDVEPLLEDGSARSTVVKTMRDLPFRAMLRLLKPLRKYMIPLFFVYLAEYWINQGLMELLTYSRCLTWISSKSQYRWFQAVYQTGVFISRSSVNVFPIEKIWLLSLLQWINFVFLLFVARYQFIPGTTIGVLILFGIILYEGLLGGGTYVNAFYRITKEVEPEYKEFSMGVASCADSTGISIAGAVSIPIHSYVCRVMSVDS